MADSWDSMRKAKEGSYFEEKNKEALKRLKDKKDAEAPRKSPITGEPMVQEVINGVVIDRCEKSGGIWLDAGELEELIQASNSEEEASNWLSGFFKGITKPGDK